MTRTNNWYAKAFRKAPIEIPLEDLVIEQYQRKQNTQRANKMAKEHNPAINSPIIVVKLANGKYAVVDGQHRLLMMEKMGATHILAVELDAKDVEDRADLFVQINSSQKTPSPNERFQASVVAGDIVAVAVDRIMRNNKFSLNGTSGTRFGSSSMAVQMYNAGVLDKTLKFINLVWPKDNRGANIDAGLIGAVGLFIQNHNTARRDRLRDVLSVQAPTQVHQVAMQANDQTRGESAKANLYMALCRMHNNGFKAFKVPKLTARDPRLIKSTQDKTDHQVSFTESDIRG